MNLQPQHFLSEPVTQDYIPRAYGAGWYYIRRVPPFTLQAVHSMLTDSRVALGLWLIKGPILCNSRFYVKCKSPEVKQFIIDQINRFWLTSAARILKSIEWGFSASEIMYTFKDSMIQFDTVRDITPTDCRVITLKGQAVGFSVKSLPSRRKKKGYVYFPRALWSIHGREHHPWYGKSRLFGSYMPWVETWTDGGFRDSRRLFVHKYAFDGGTLYHPMGSAKVQDAGTGEAQVISYKELARELLEKRKNGGGLTLPNTIVDGHRVWEYVPPEVVAYPEALNVYGTDLRQEILEGMGIPPEVIESGGGGILGDGGRQVPQQAFYSTLQEIVFWTINDFDTYSIRPMVSVNFGHQDYEIIPFGLLSNLSDDKESEPQPQPPQLADANEDLESSSTMALGNMVGHTMFMADLEERLDAEIMGDYTQDRIRAALSKSKVKHTGSTTSKKDKSGKLHGAAGGGHGGQFVSKADSGTVEKPSRKAKSPGKKTRASGSSSSKSWTPGENPTVPKGKSITIGGTTYNGGDSITKEELAKATIAEKKQLRDLLQEETRKAPTNRATSADKGKNTAKRVGHLIALYRKKIGTKEVKVYEEVPHPDKPGKTKRVWTGAYKTVDDIVWKRRDGKAMPAHVKPGKIPPGYTDIHVFDSPHSDVVAIGRNKDGNAWQLETDDFKKRSKERHNRRVAELIAKWPTIRNKVWDEMAEGSQVATVVGIMMANAVRVGTRDPKGKKKIHGARTLFGKHIVLTTQNPKSPTGVRLEFVGKKGVEHSHAVRDEALASALRQLKSVTGDDERLFPDVTAKDVSEYTSTLDGGLFSCHDFRRAVACMITRREIAAVKRHPKNLKEVREKIKEICEKVSKVLGNNPSEAFKSYINPSYWTLWHEALLEEGPKGKSSKASTMSLAPTLHPEEEDEFSFNDMLPNPEVEVEVTYEPESEEGPLDWRDDFDPERDDPDEEANLGSPIFDAADIFDEEDEDDEEDDDSPGEEDDDDDSEDEENEDAEA